MTDEDVDHDSTHALPIEDPLDADHDLGRVLRPEGWVRILEESIRASGIIESNRKVAELFTHVTPNRTPEDRFADLRGLSSHDLRERIEQSIGDEANFQSRIKALDRALHHATRYRNATQGKLESANLPGAIASQVEHLRSTIADASAARDRARSIGKVRTVDLSAALSKRFSELSEDQSLRTLVDLEREDRVFAEFLALQAMHSASSEAIDTMGVCVKLKMTSTGSSRRPSHPTMTNRRMRTLNPCSPGHGRQLHERSDDESEPSGRRSRRDVLS